MIETKKWEKGHCTNKFRRRMGEWKMAFEVVIECTDITSNRRCG